MAEHLGLRSGLHRWHVRNNAPKSTYLNPVERNFLTQRERELNCHPRRGYTVLQAGKPAQEFSSCADPLAVHRAFPSHAGYTVMEHPL